MLIIGLYMRFTSNRKEVKSGNNETTALRFSSGNVEGKKLTEEILTYYEVIGLSGLYKTKYKNNSDWLNKSPIIIDEILNEHELNK